MPSSGLQLIIACQDLGYASSDSVYTQHLQPAGVADPGSLCRISDPNFSIPDPGFGYASKNLSIFNLQNCRNKGFLSFLAG
jgi:hypothetical protein